MKTLRWGILGAGHIAGKWASDLALVEGAQLQAVWARDPAKSVEFGERFKAPRVAGSITELLAVGDLDAVYVATPHGRHHDDVMACLEAGIPVLCEKAFALNSTQAREMVQAARSRKVLLMEALWTRFLPNFQEGLRLVTEGSIGRPVSITTDFGFVSPYAPERRLWDPAMGGGALLDIGLYPLFFAREFLGPFESLEVEWTPAPNGVERRIQIAGIHSGGARSHSVASFDENLGCLSVLEAEAGKLVFERMFHTPTDLEVTDSQGVSRHLSFVREGFGYQHETSHFCSCLLEGLLESPLWTLSRSLEQMELLDAVRAAMAFASAD